MRLASVREDPMVGRDDVASAPDMSMTAIRPRSEISMAAVHPCSDVSLTSVRGHNAGAGLQRLRGPAVDHHWP